MLSLFGDTYTGVGTTKMPTKTKTKTEDAQMTPLGLDFGTYGQGTEGFMKYIESLQKKEAQPADTTYQAPSMLTGTERMRGTKARGKLLGKKKNANY